MQLLTRFFVTERVMVTYAQITATGNGHPASIFSDHPWVLLLLLPKVIVSSS